MKQKGRKSGAEMATTATVTRIEGPPKPPGDLPLEAAQVWREVTASRPPGWWNAANLPLLEHYCRFVAQFRQVSRAIDLLSLPDDLDEYRKLTRLQDILAGRVATLATKQRLTQQAVTDSRAAGRAEQRGQPRVDFSQLRRAKDD